MDPTLSKKISLPSKIIERLAGFIFGVVLLAIIVRFLPSDAFIKFLTPDTTIKLAPHQPNINYVSESRLMIVGGIIHFLFLIANYPKSENFVAKIIMQ